MGRARVGHRGASDVAHALRPVALEGLVAPCGDRGHPCTGVAVARFVVATLVASAALGAGCLGRQMGFDGTTFRKGAIAFRVPPPPPSWRRVEVTDASLSFRDDALGASILVNARCEVTAADTPLPALRNQLIAGTTDREMLAEETIPFDAREALHSKLTAKLDGVRLSYDIYVLKKDGCTYDFVLLADAQGEKATAPAFDAFVMGFHTLPGSGTVSALGRQRSRARRC